MASTELTSRSPDDLARAPEEQHRRPRPLQRSSSTMTTGEEEDRRRRAAARRSDALERRSASGAVQAGIWRSYSLPWEPPSAILARPGTQLQAGDGGRASKPPTLRASYHSGEAGRELGRERYQEDEEDSRGVYDNDYSKTDPTAEESDSEVSCSSTSSSSSSEPCDWVVGANTRMGHSGIRRQFHRKGSTMTHITERTEHSGGRGASSEDSAHRRGSGVDTSRRRSSALSRQSSLDVSWRSGRRSSWMSRWSSLGSAGGGGGFDVMAVPMPEETALVTTATDCVNPGKGYEVKIERFGSGQFQRRGSDDNGFPTLEDLRNDLFPVQNLSNLNCYERDGNGSGGKLGDDLAFGSDDEAMYDEQEGLRKLSEEVNSQGTASNEAESEQPLSPSAHTEKEEEADKDEAANNHGGKNTKKHKRTSKRRKRRQRLTMRRASMNENGFELDLMVPSDTESSFHSRTPNAIPGGGLDASQHSLRSTLPVSRHSQGVPFLDSSCHSRGSSAVPTSLLRRMSSSHRYRSSGRRGSYGSITALTALGRGCSQASMFSDDTSVGYGGHESSKDHLDFSLHDYTGIIPEIKRNLSADDLISLAADDEEQHTPESDAFNQSQSTLFCSALDGGRFLVLGASPTDKSAGLHVLSPPLMEALQSHLPFAVSGQNFWLKYSLVQHGASLMTLLDNVPADAHTILAIETEEGEVFGSFTSTAWRKDWNYYGSGFGAFLWRMKGSRGASPSSTGSAGEGASSSSPPQNHRRSVFDQTKAEGDVEVFKWSGRNDFTQLCTSEKIAVGGGVEKVADWLNDDSGMPMPSAPGFGLCVDDDMFQGTSSPCATFASPPLSMIHSDGSPFNILNVEVWALTPCISVEEALKMELMKTFHAEMRAASSPRSSC